MKLFFLVGRTNKAMRELQAMLARGDTPMMAPPLALPPAPEPPALPPPPPPPASLDSALEGGSSSTLDREPLLSSKSGVEEGHDEEEEAESEGESEVDGADAPTMLMPSRSKSFFARSASKVASMFSGDAPVSVSPRGASEHARPG